MIDAFLSFYKQSPVGAILAVSGLLVGLLGLAFAVYTWIFGRKKKEISYAVESFELIKKKKSTVPKLKLLFDNQEIESLTVTKIRLWNSGNDAIRRTDIVEDKPLVISAKGTIEILEIQVEKMSDESNHFSVEMKDRIPIIDFKYMNKKEGAVLQVYHTGPADGFALDCKIIGGSKPKNRGVSDIKIIDSLFFIVAACAIIAAIVGISVVAAANGAIPFDIGNSVMAIFTLIQILGLISAFLVLIICRKQSSLFSSIPKNLR